jgi:hypothetical protein
MSAPFDRWFRYPAGFASDYVSRLFQDLDLKSGSLVIDPFAGSGVTGTSCRMAHYDFFGIEAHPLIAELATLKLRPIEANTQELPILAKELTLRVASEIEVNAEQVNLLINSETELVRRSFSETTLSQLVILRNFIKEGEIGGSWWVYLKWALLSTLRDVASVKVGWPYQRPGEQRKPKYADPLARFVQRATWIAEDLMFSQVDPNNSRIVTGDASAVSSWPADHAWSQGCVSSPPYLNNFDYADATRLELYFWGYAATWSEMCSTVRKDMVTATTQQSSVGTAQKAIDELKEYERPFEEIRSITAGLANQRLSRKRGKEYDRVVPDYFSAIARVLKSLAQALEPGAPSVWLIGDSAPYGVYVDTPRLVGELAEEVGFSLEKDTVLRRRGQRWSGNASRHNIELTERSLIFRRR